MSAPQETARRPWSRRRKFLNLALGAAALWWWGGGLAAPASFLSDTRSVVLYDADGPCRDDARLARSTRAPGDPAMFRRAARAQHRWGRALWKGSTCARLTLADGREVRLRLSYYGGFFAIEGQRGVYVIPPEGYKAWHTEHRRVIFTHFMPRRIERNAAAAGAARLK